MVHAVRMSELGAIRRTSKPGHPRSGEPAHRPQWLVPVLVGVVSTVILGAGQLLFRHFNRDVLPFGYLLQDWPSDIMMQTLSLQDMFDFGPLALWYNHVYPPMQDVLRYVFSTPRLINGLSPDYQAVDLLLYATYAACFGLVNAVVYLWVRDLTRNGYFAGLITLLWAVSPGFLTNMMLLDSTPLAMASISWALYFLYRFLRTRRLGYVPWFLLMVLLGSLARNITQSHVLLMLVGFTIAAWWLADNTSKGRLMAVSIGLLALLFVMPIKQQVMFGTTDTSTFSGIHRVGMLWIPPSTIPESEYPDVIVQNASRFESKYNSVEAALENHRLANAAAQAWVSDPLGSVAAMGRSLTITVPEFLRPSSQYVDNYLVRELPWRAAFDWVFSGWRYSAVVLGALALVWAARGSKGMWSLARRYGWFAAFYALIAAPVFWSNRYIPGHEDQGPIWTDAIRLKMFLEVPLVALVGYALWLVVKWAMNRWPSPLRG